MIQNIITYSCRGCGSTNIVNNGTNRPIGNDGGVQRVLVPKREEKTQRPFMLKAYQERMSLRGLSRVYGMHRPSISRWIVDNVKRLPTCKDTLLPANPDDVSEDDEAWSCVL